ncbi:MAG: TrmB family transcriptional regulator [Candidatus Kariarchaeaceae archaeon]|jgi:predicted transcriptional regulator
MSRKAYPELISILSDFSATSFTELQASAYVALIKMGEETGSAVAGEAGINRSKIYDILGQLEEMGAVKKISREGKTKYVAVAPDELLPKLIDKFAEGIQRAQEGLQDIKDLQEEIDEAKITLTTLDLAEVDTNAFDYLISSGEHHRLKFTDKLERDKRPNPAVKILNLNRTDGARGVILLLGADIAYIFGTPTGMKVEALAITSAELIMFIRGLIESWWTDDIPEYIKDEIEKGDRLAMVIDKALSVKYELFTSNQEYVYERPISMVISDEHISFFYEQIEELKIPLGFLSTAELYEDGVTIHVTFANPSKVIGDLTMRVVTRPYLITNILKYIARTKSREN